jgi:hypothetical protein
VTIEVHVCSIGLAAFCLNGDMSMAGQFLR